MCQTSFFSFFGKKWKNKFIAKKEKHKKYMKGAPTF
jgi:hypothetical protein